MVVIPAKAGIYCADSTVPDREQNLRQHGFRLSPE